MTLRPYTPDLATAWDELVRTSRNGTFLFERAYMDYHADRFRDASLLFYNDKGILVGLLPASWRNEDAPSQSSTTIVSHGGLTYGGFITTTSTHATDVGEMMDLAIDHYRSLGVRQLIVKPVPTIYHRHPADDELYWLFRHGARLTARGLSSTIDLTAPLPFSTLRRRKIAKAQRAEYVVDKQVSDASLADFWTILTDVLRERHDLKPVHSLDEIRLLCRRFPDRIRLVVVRNAEGSIVAGTLLYITQQVIHAQYIASSAEGRENGALELLFAHLVNEYTTPLRDTFARYFDFGISTENGGQYLNEGLIFQKEGFGARSTIYDAWTLEL